MAEKCGSTMPKVEIEGLDKLIKKRMGKTDWMGDAITKALRQSGLAIQREAAILAPVNTGALRQSITTEVDKRPPFALWVTVGPTVKYGRYVEFGRGPGKPPPTDAIEPWVRTKLRVSSPRSFRVAYLVARKIAQKGVKPRPYMFPGAEKAAGAIDKIWMNVKKDIARAWGKKI
jgi:hypothetical protein